MQPIYREINSGYRRLSRLNLEIIIYQESLDESASLAVIDKDSRACVLEGFTYGGGQWLRPSDFRYAEPFSFMGDAVSMLADEVEAKLSSRAS